MIEAWLNAFVPAFGRLFMNPLLYWIIILLLIVNFYRTRKMRKNFGAKVSNRFAELKSTFMISLICSVLITVIMLGVGIVFSAETLLLLTSMAIVLSLFNRFNLLSASYTIGFTYILLLLLPFISREYALPENINFIGLTVLLGLVLIVEAVGLSRVKVTETFPELLFGKRGMWVGQHRIKKLIILPFILLVPTGLIESFASYWPYIPIGGHTYSLFILPFITGFDYKARANLPIQISKRLAKSTLLLGIIVLICAAGSIYIRELSLVAIGIAIIGKEWINYKHRMRERNGVPYFQDVDRGIKILATIPNTTADRLKLVAGEIIVKVNGIKITNPAAFYNALHTSEAFCRLEVLDWNGEIRIAQAALYQTDHYYLGILFVDIPYKYK